MNKGITWGQLIIVTIILFVAYYLWVNKPTTGNLPATPSTTPGIRQDI